MKFENKILLLLPIILLLSFGLALCGSYSGNYMYGMPIFVVAIAVVFIIQWIAFAFAYVAQTEKFYDLTGSFTYIFITFSAALSVPLLDSTRILLSVLIIIWAGRLGTFLFVRTIKAGGDLRFSKIKISFYRFLIAWSLQGLWIGFTLSAMLAAITGTTYKDLSIYAYIGFVIWCFGFALEVIADWQKSKFKADSENKDKFIDKGLWAYSRHPNYFGEITLWFGIAVIAFPLLKGWQYLTLISPLFVTILITRISGINILEERAENKWGKQEDYQKYKNSTSVLIPCFIKKAQTK